jgi:hypothetical protein
MNINYSLFYPIYESGKEILIKEKGKQSWFFVRPEYFYNK